MKKGFTLIELLGVIALLGLLAAISIPIIDSSLNKAREGLDETQKKQIIKGAEDYYAENLQDLPDCDPNCTDEKTLKFLQDKGYLPMNIIDESKGAEYDASLVKIRVTLTKTTNDKGEIVKKYDYEIKDNG